MHKLGISYPMIDATERYRNGRKSVGNILNR